MEEYEGVEGTEYEDDELEFDDDTELEDVEESDEEDEFGWVREAGPDKVKKTWTQYTQTRQELAERQREYERKMAELEPILRLRDDVQKDPGLVKMLDDYYKNGRPADLEIQDVKTQVASLQAQLATERELSNVRQWIRENDYPDTDDKAILEYAVENGIANLRAAYKDMMFDKVQDRKAQKLEEGIKRSRGAKSISPKKPANAGASLDVAKLSDEDFISNYTDILKRYQQ